MLGCKTLGTALLAAMVAAVCTHAAAGTGCRGKEEACAALVLSEDGCKLTNTSDREMQVFVNKTDGGFATYTIGSGQSQKTRPADGCLQVGKTVADYTVTLLLPSLPSVFGKTKKTGPRCTGDSCKTVGLTVRDGCMWLTSRAKEPVTVAVKHGGKTDTYGLEAATLNPTPGDDRFAGTYGKKYDAFMKSDYGTFSVKIGGPKDCVADKSKIDAYAANVIESGTAVAGIVNLHSKSAKGSNQAAAPEKPKGKAKHSPLRPCSGDACDVLFAERGRLERCRILNGGRQSIKVRVTTHRGGVLTTPPMAPGAESSLGTPMGCIPVENIATFEANYAR